MWPRGQRHRSHGRSHDTTLRPTNSGMVVQFAPYLAALRSPKVETARQVQWVSDWVTGRLPHPPGPAICKGDPSSHIVDAAVSCSIASRIRRKALAMPMLTSSKNCSSREELDDDMSLEKKAGWSTQ